MNGNVHRADVHLNYPVDIALTQIGQRNIISKQKGKARVIVFKIERLPHAGRKLVDKTEHALVPAGMLLIHQIGCKFKPDRFILPFTQMQRPHSALRVFDRQGQMRIGLIKPVVEHIINFVFIDGEKRLTGLNS